ncbi:MAG: hypothetical protein U0263_32180 [Polyangiaceae bacterium]
MPLSLWAEQMTDSEIESALPLLARLGLGLGLALPAERVGDPSFAALTRRLATAGIPARIWPLLPEAQGYWIGESNVDAARELFEALLAWRRHTGGPAFDALSVDLEPDLEYSEALRKTARRRPDLALGMLRAHVRPTQHVKARAVLARAVARLGREGVYTHAVTYPMVLDQKLGDSTLEDALSLVVTGVEWDEVSFMVYQTPFAQLLGTWLGPALVSSYAVSAVERFGDRAGIDVGIVGDHGVGLDPGARYAEPAALEADLAAALAAGIPLERTRVYGLAGALEAGGLQRWFSTEPRAHAPRPSRTVAGFRNLVTGLATGLRLGSR